MKIEELQTILTYAQTDARRRVMIRVEKPNKRVANLDISSFSTYDDGIVLNVEVGSDF